MKPSFSESTVFNSSSFGFSVFEESERLNQKQKTPEQTASPNSSSSSPSPTSSAGGGGDKKKPKEKKDKKKKKRGGQGYGSVMSRWAVLGPSKSSAMDDKKGKSFNRSEQGDLEYAFLYESTKRKGPDIESAEAKARAQSKAAIIQAASRRGNRSSRRKRRRSSSPTGATVSSPTSAAGTAAAAGGGDGVGIGRKSGALTLVGDEVKSEDEDDKTTSSIRRGFRAMRLAAKTIAALSNRPDSNWSTRTQLFPHHAFDVFCDSQDLNMSSSLHPVVSDWAIDIHRSIDRPFFLWLSDWRDAEASFFNIMNDSSVSNSTSSSSSLTPRQQQAQQRRMSRNGQLPRTRISLERLPIQHPDRSEINQVPIFVPNLDNFYYPHESTVVNPRNAEDFAMFRPSVRRFSGELQLGDQQSHLVCPTMPQVMQTTWLCTEIQRSEANQKLLDVVFQKHERTLGRIVARVFYAALEGDRCLMLGLQQFKRFARNARIGDLSDANWETHGLTDAEVAKTEEALKIAIAKGRGVSEAAQAALAASKTARQRARDEDAFGINSTKSSSGGGSNSNNNNKPTFTASSLAAASSSEGEGKGGKQNNKEGEGAEEEEQEQEEEETEEEKKSTHNKGVIALMPILYHQLCKPYNGLSIASFTLSLFFLSEMMYRPGEVVKKEPDSDEEDEEGETQQRTKSFKSPSSSSPSHHQSFIDKRLQQYEEEQQRKEEKNKKLRRRNSSITRDKVNSFISNAKKGSSSNLEKTQQQQQQQEGEESNNNENKKGDDDDDDQKEQHIEWIPFVEEQQNNNDGGNNNNNDSSDDDEDSSRKPAPLKTAVSTAFSPDSVYEQQQQKEMEQELLRYPEGATDHDILCDTFVIFIRNHLLPFLDTCLPWYTDPDISTVTTIPRVHEMVTREYDGMLKQLFVLSSQTPHEDHFYSYSGGGGGGGAGGGGFGIAEAVATLEAQEAAKEGESSPLGSSLAHASGSLAAMSGTFTNNASFTGGLASNVIDEETKRPEDRFAERAELQDNVISGQVLQRMIQTLVPITLIAQRDKELLEVIDQLIWSVSLQHADNPGKTRAREYWAQGHTCSAIVLWENAAVRAHQIDAGEGPARNENMSLQRYFQNASAAELNSSRPSSIVAFTDPLDSLSISYDGFVEALVRVAIICEVGRESSLKFPTLSSIEAGVGHFLRRKVTTLSKEIFSDKMVPREELRAARGYDRKDGLPVVRTVRLVSRTSFLKEGPSVVYFHQADLGCPNALFACIHRAVSVVVRPIIADQGGTFVVPPLKQVLRTIAQNGDYAHAPHTVKFRVTGRLISASSIAVKVSYVHIFELSFGMYGQNWAAVPGNYVREHSEISPPFTFVTPTAMFLREETSSFNRAREMIANSPSSALRSIMRFARNLVISARRCVTQLVSSGRVHSSTSSPAGGSSSPTAASASGSSRVKSGSSVRFEEEGEEGNQNKNNNNSRDNHHEKKNNEQPIDEMGVALGHLLLGWSLCEKRRSSAKSFSGPSSSSGAAEDESGSGGGGGALGELSMMSKQDSNNNNNNNEALEEDFFSASVPAALLRRSKQEQQQEQSQQQRPQPKRFSFSSDEDGDDGDEENHLISSSSGAPMSPKTARLKSIALLASSTFSNMSPLTSLQDFSLNSPARKQMQQKRNQQSKFAPSSSPLSLSLSSSGSGRGNSMLQIQNTFALLRRATLDSDSLVTAERKKETTAEEVLDMLVGGDHQKTNDTLLLMRKSRCTVQTPMLDSDEEFLTDASTTKIERTHTVEEFAAEFLNDILYTDGAWVARHEKKMRERQFADQISSSFSSDSQHPSSPLVGGSIRHNALFTAPTRLAIVLATQILRSSIHAYKLQLARAQLGRRRSVGYGLLTSSSSSGNLLSSSVSSAFRRKSSASPSSFASVISAATSAAASGNGGTNQSSSPSSPSTASSSINSATPFSLDNYPTRAGPLKPRPPTAPSNKSKTSSPLVQKKNQSLTEAERHEQNENKVAGAVGKVMSNVMNSAVGNNLDDLLLGDGGGEGVGGFTFGNDYKDGGNPLGVRVKRSYFDRSLILGMLKNGISTQRPGWHFLLVSRGRVLASVGFGGDAVDVLCCASAGSASSFSQTSSSHFAPMRPLGFFDLAHTGMNGRRPFLWTRTFAESADKELRNLLDVAARRVTKGSSDRNALVLSEFVAKSNLNEGDVGDRSAIQLVASSTFHNFVPYKNTSSILSSAYQSITATSANVIDVLQHPTSCVVYKIYLEDNLRTTFTPQVLFGTIVESNHAASSRPFSGGFSTLSFQIPQFDAANFAVTLYSVVPLIEVREWYSEFVLNVATHEASCSGVAVSATSDETSFGPFTVHDAPQPGIVACVLHLFREHSMDRDCSFLRKDLERRGFVVKPEFLA